MAQTMYVPLLSSSIDVHQQYDTNAFQSVFDKCITQFCNSYVNSQLSYNNLNGHQDHISATMSVSYTISSAELVH